MTTKDDRPAIEKVEPKPSEAVPDDEDIDETLEESFPASDPPSYSKGLPKTE